ncbi:MAG: S41 family peptidase [Lachnospiraceae bacterium]|nr:S41 family peptidase [Lachnospiraceae bacterium]
MKYGKISKFIAFLLTIFMVAGFTACGNEVGSYTDSVKDTTKDKSDIVTNITDGQQVVDNKNNIVENILPPKTDNPKAEDKNNDTDDKSGDDKSGNDDTTEKKTSAAIYNAKLREEPVYRDEPVLDDTLKSLINLFDNLIDDVCIYNVTNEELRNGMLKGMFEAIGDPYSCFYTKKEYDEIMESTSGNYCGIGSYVSQNLQSMVITITRPFPDSPAAKAGIMKGDHIYTVDGEDVRGMDLSSVVAKMKGEPDTKVIVGVERDGVYIEFEITRAPIVVNTIEYEMLDNNIGYISMVEFIETSAEDFKKAYDELEKQGMQGLIFDLRDNPGGLLNVVLEIADYIIEDNTPDGQKSLLTFTKDREGKVEIYNCSDGHSLNIPMAVLVNQASASASELFTAAVKAHGKATIVGTNTFGKGIVQSIFPLTNGMAVKLTTSEYYTPNGECFHGVGVAPDYEVLLDDDVRRMPIIPHELDSQLQKAIECLKKKFVKENLVLDK